jgi:hypothetical protein
LDVGLCLKLLPTGESFKFILEKDKLLKIRKVIAHNNGEVLSEEASGNDIVIRVRKLNEPKESFSP